MIANKTFDIEDETKTFLENINIKNEPERLAEIGRHFGASGVYESSNNDFWKDTEWRTSVVALNSL